MKSKLFKKYKKEQEDEQVEAHLDEEEHEYEDEKAEVYSANTGVSSSKNNKMMVVFASAILITVVIYFLFFKGENQINVAELEEVSNQTVVGSETPSSGSPAGPDETISLFENAPDDDILITPKIPEIPALPTIPAELTFPTLPPFDPSIGVETVNQVGTNSSQSAQIPQIPVEIPLDIRRSPIIVESTGVGGLAASALENDRFAGGIIPLNEDAIDSLENTANSIIPTIVRDRETTIIQGKMMTAVLETAINTEIPGSIRGIISRDVYAESGFNILIPKGSRLFGSYSTNIVRGQGRVEINWSRLIRPDGVDLSIGFVAADQFGRSGIEGDVNNKYGAALTNSLLTSILAIGGAIGAEKLSGADNNTTTSSPTTGTTTMTSSPSAQVIADVATTLVSTVSEISTNAINLSPVIRVPQGTKMTIVVNADMSIPKMRGRR
ncbi:MAG: type IV secretion system protein VirB10 [Rickettsiales bacterium]|jgi:type IV secretion system protein VirB10